MKRNGTIQGTFIGLEQYGMLLQTESGKTYSFGPAPGIDFGNLKVGDKVKIEYAKASFSKHRVGPDYHALTLEVLE